MPDTSERRSRLLGVKLRALVADHLGRSLDLEPSAFPSGAALVVDGAAWVLVEGRADRSLGGALAWALRQHATSLDLIAEADTGLLARRAERLALPVTVWFAEDRVLLPAVAEPLADPARPIASHLALADMITVAGADVNVEHGVVTGTVAGLEVCRVVERPTTGHITEPGDIDPSLFAVDGVQLEVGVGDNDREAFRLIHGEMPTPDALATVVEAVAKHRSREAPQHPLNRLAQERFDRWRLQGNPALIEMQQVEPAEPPLARANLKDAVPCVASAVDPSGRVCRVVCSVGVDVDLVGFVADVQATSDDPVIVVLRERDRVAITEELLALLASQVEIRTI